MMQDNRNTQARRKGRPSGKQKEGRTVSCYLRDDLYAGLVRYCEETGLSKTAVIERSVQELLEKKRGGLQDGQG